MFILLLLQDTLLALAKAVANATAALVLKGKGVASKCENQDDQNMVIGTATQCALATSQLVACTKVCIAGRISQNKEKKISFCNDKYMSTLS